jgi:hypothetical protein
MKICLTTLNNQWFVMIQKMERFATEEMGRREMISILPNTGHEQVNFIVPVCVFPGKLTN